MNPPKDKVHALLLAMSEEIRILRAIAEEHYTPDEIPNATKAKLATQAAAIAVGCRPDGPLNS